MRGIVVSAGNKVSEEILKKYLNDSYIVCCDGGIKNFYELNVLPNLIVGDFDSIDETGRKFIEDNNIEKNVYNTVKNFTDTEAAIEILLEREFEEIVIFGATGTRLDHTLANIFLLQKLFGKSKAIMVDNNNIIEYVEKGEYFFEKDEHTYISVVAISEEMIYSTYGMEYEADELKILTSEIRGVSNELKGDTGKIIVHEGRGFIIRSID